MLPMTDLFLVTVALPSIARGLGATLASAEWVVTAYSLALGLLPVVAGRLSDLWGPGRMLAFGVLLFLLGSVAGATAPTLGFLIVARALQGVGAAGAVPASLALIACAYEPRERGFPLGVWGAVASLGSILGPLVGGFVIERAGWRWAVVSTVPLGRGARDV